MSSKNDDKNAKKRADWTNNPKITMDIKKSDDCSWKTNKKVVMQTQETYQDKDSKK